MRLGSLWRAFDRPTAIYARAIAAATVPSRILISAKVPSRIRSLTPRCPDAVVLLPVPPTDSGPPCVLVRSFGCARLKLNDELRFEVEDARVSRYMHESTCQKGMARQSQGAGTSLHKCRPKSCWPSTPDDIAQHRLFWVRGGKAQCEHNMSGYHPLCSVRPSACAGERIAHEVLGQPTERFHRGPNAAPPAHPTVSPSPVRFTCCAG